MSRPSLHQSRYVYHNITAFLASVILTWALWEAHVFHDAFAYINAQGYLGVFVVGMIFVSSFTVVPATAALIVLANDLNVLLVALLAGAGATIGDYFIFRFVRDGLAEDLRQLFAGVPRFRPLRIFRSRYFSMITPAIGAIIIAAPLPDELGVGLLGLSRMKVRSFVALAFVLNTVGIFALLSLLHKAI